MTRAVPTRTDAWRILAQIERGQVRRMFRLGMIERVDCRAGTDQGVS